VNPTPIPTDPDREPPGLLFCLTLIAFLFVFIVGWLAIVTVCETACKPLRWGLRRECCKCKRWLGGNPWANTVSHGYCHTHKNDMLREIREWEA